MCNSHRLEPRVLSILLGIALAACGVDSGVSIPSAPASPADGGATLTGVNSSGMDTDAAVTELGDNPSTATVAGGSSEAAAGSDPSGIGSGGASSGSVGGIGGATFTRGGAAGAGGSQNSGGPSGAAGHAGASAGAGGATTIAPVPTTLYFSEYVEGSSSNKALEITANEHSVLDTCKVGAYFNGSAEASVVASLSGVLEAGQVLTLCTSTLKTKLGAVCEQIGRLTFNGNDAVALECDGKILDVIGQIGVDPGAAWGKSSNTTLDHTLQRKCTVAHGDSNGSDAFDPSIEWNALPADTFSGLGKRGC